MKGTLALIGGAAEGGSIAGNTSGERARMPGFPSEIAAEIVRFLASGATGDVQINVKQGRIINCRVSTYVYADQTVDDKRHRVQDSET